MRRTVTCLLVVLTILFVAEIRLSRSEPRLSEPPPPALWENANPPGRPSPSPVVSRSERGLTVTYPAPAMNCPIVISTDPDSQNRLTAVENGVLLEMRLWRDANHNGKSEPSELRPAEDELSAIGLGFQRERRVDRHGNQSRFRGFVQVRTAPGKNMATTTQDERARRRYMYEVCLVAQ